MRILIFGSCGFIGTNTALKAIEQGNEVIAFDNLSRIGTEYNLEELNKHKHFSLIRGDIRNCQDFKRIPEVDAVIHLAAQPGIPWSISYPKYDFKVNALGTINMLEFARERGNLPTIFSSTNKVYSEAINSIPMTEKETRYIWDMFKGIPETFPVNSQGKFPHSPYGCSKLTSDLYCQEYYHIYGVPTVVCRQSCIAGRFQLGCQSQGWVAWFCYAKLFNLPINIYGDGKQVRDILNADDLADLYLLLLQNISTHKGRVYNVGGGPEFSRSLIEIMRYLEKKDGKPFEVTYKDWRPADHRIYISDISKISKYWKPKINPEETIEQIWNWAIKHKDIIQKFLKEL